MSILSVDDYQDIDSILKEAQQYAESPWKDQHLGTHKSLLLLFANPSLRTRLSTQKAGIQLGMQVQSMDLSGGWNLEYQDGATMNEQSAEHIKEAAQVVSQYADVIGLRSFPTLLDRDADDAETAIRQLDRYASRPVVNMESCTEHPLQALTDALTIEQFKSGKPRPKVVLSWAPHPRKLPQAVANSFVKMMKRRPVELVITHPPGMELNPEITDGIPIVYDQEEAFANADFVYAKNWSSYLDYGRQLYLPEWTIDSRQMNRTSDAYFMHCLPVRRNVVVSDRVIDSPKSLVIQQANNRTFAAQAVIAQWLRV